MKCISLFKCNHQIEVIDKSHCSLEDVPNFQNYSRSLEELFLDANKLTHLNEYVFKLTKLRRFSFSDNAIQDIPADIAKLVNLVELDCSRNKIQIIPEQIKFLRGLQICDFSANNIEYLPPGLVQLKNLTCLTLNYCPIKNLPEDFGLLKNLESLELRENELESLPASITGLESLKKLDLGRNLISKLPEDIGKLSNLEYLLVDGNRLETIPAKIGKLENLQCLDLSQQEYGLKHLPDEISGLVSLTDLHLSENHLQSLPDGIGQLKSLAIFKADNNYLSELNPNIGGCASLQELVLTSNSITKLPSTISSLTDLRSLNLDNNLIKQLAPQIGHLKKLRILSLRDNLLTHLPNEIGQLSLLRVLDVSGNRIEYLPISIADLGLKALWLSKNQAQPRPTLQIDEVQNNRILTCYLLPQQSDEEETPNQEDNAQTEFENHNRQPAVSFDAAAVDEAELSGDVNFVRHDTPHPRELKARHQKLFNVPDKVELRGHDNASFCMSDNQQNIDSGYGAQDPSAVPTSYQQQIEYGSNGLPEVPTSITEQSITKSPYTRAPPPPPDRGAYHPQEIQHKVDQPDNEDYERDNRFSYDNGFEGLRIGKVQLKEQTKEYRSEGVFDNNNQLDSEVSLNSKFYILDILVRRSKNHKPGLGLSIAGGKDTPPFKDNDEGIFVSKVIRGGPAEAAGVKLGDKILAVNNNSFYDGITHQKAVDIFKKVKPDCAEGFTMRILRDPNYEYSDQDDDYLPPAESVACTTVPRSIDNSVNTFTRTYTIPTPGEANGSNTKSNLRQYLSKESSEKAKSAASTLPPSLSLVDNSLSKHIIYTTLVKDYKNDLGLVLENRTDEGETRSWPNVVISHIKPNSIAARDGKLQPDDRLLSINGVDVTGIDIDRIASLLGGTERFIRIVVSRGDNEDPIGAALKSMPVRPPLGSWFSSTSNMSHRPSLIESYQRPTFGSVSSLQKQNSVLGSKPPKPPKPSYLLQRDDLSRDPTPVEDNPIVKPRARGFDAATDGSDQSTTQLSEAERRAAWRRDRLKSIDDDVETAKALTEAYKIQHQTENK